MEFKSVEEILSLDLEEDDALIGPFSVGDKNSYTLEVMHPGWNCQLVVLDAVDAFLRRNLNVDMQEFKEVVSRIMRPCVFIHLTDPDIMDLIEQHFEVLYCNEIVARNGHIQYHILFKNPRYIPWG